MRNKTLLSKSGTITDLSVNLDRYRSGNETINITTDDYLYFGQFYPFNSLYFVVQTANDEAANPTIEIWDSNGWVEAVEIVDETNSGGVPLAQSGHIMFVPNRYNRWAYEDTVNQSGTERVTGLGNVTIYDRYWMRLSFSANIKTTTALSFVGTKFSNDDDLMAEHSVLLDSDFLESWESGKTSWEEQHVVAASLIIDEMIKKNFIAYPGQIIDRFTMKNLAIPRTAAVIYAGLKMWDEYNSAIGEFNKRLKGDIFNIDKNKNAIMEHSESGIVQGGLYR